MMVFSAEKKVVRVWHTETEPQSDGGVPGDHQRLREIAPGHHDKAGGSGLGRSGGQADSGPGSRSPPDAAHGQAVTCASFYAKGLLRDQEDIAASIGRDNILKAVRMQCYHDGKYYGIPHSAPTIAPDLPEGHLQGEGVEAARDLG